MGTIRLGKRTDNRTPLIKDFVPLAALDDLVFGGWDIFPDNAYEAAVKAGVLEAQHLEPIKDFLEGDQADGRRCSTTQYVKKLDGPNVKKGKTKSDLAEQLSRRHRATSRRSNGCDRLVMVWCGSTEIYREAGEVHATLATFEKGLDESDPDIAPSMIYAYARDQGGRPLRQRRAEPDGRLPGAGRARARDAACRSPARTSRPARR